MVEPTLHFVATEPLARGGGEPLVFLHALGCDHLLWENVAAGFADRHRMMRYDLRGHGKSETGGGESTIADHVRDLIGLLDRLAIGRATLLGISVGGMIALATAQRHPDRVQRLVLCATAARIGTSESWTDRIAAVRAKGLAGMADAILARWFTPEFAVREPAIVTAHRERLERTSLEGYLATCAALRDADLRADLPNVRAPALVLAGQHDLAVPLATARELADRLPHARWRLVECCAHLPPVEQPTEVSAAIASFLAETA